MKKSKWFASFLLASTCSLFAETNCPGNVASVPFRLVNRHKIIISVSVNHSRPSDFLLDTGTQVSMIDPSIADGLHLETEGTAVVAGASSRQSASFAQLDRLEIGGHAVSNQRVLVYSLANLRSADLQIEGVLGEDFLEHFDMLIDNVHSLLCLDETGAMRAAVKGAHVPLLASAGPEDGAELAALPIITARLSDGTRPVRLMLDSGAAAPVLYNTSRYMALPLSRSAFLRGNGVDGAQRIFSALPPQDVNFGSRELSTVPFFSLDGTQKDAVTKGFDGVLPTGLFRRVFIDHADCFAVLEP